MPDTNNASQMTPKERAEAFLREHKLSITSKFVPFSQSRNKDSKHPMLNWKITLLKDGKEVLSTDYSAGYAHCPGDKIRLNLGPASGHYAKQCRDAIVSAECQRGHECRWNESRSVPESITPFKEIKPDAVDVFHSLLIDSDVLESGGFEDWASNYGYDTDSRKAEKMFRACIEIALKLQAGIGADVMQKAREAFQDC